MIGTVGERRVGDTASAPRTIVPFGEPDGHRSPGRSFDRDRPVDLPGKHPDDLKTEGLDLFEVDAAGDSDAAVPDLEGAALVVVFRQPDDDFPRPLIRKSVTDRVQDKLVDDQTERDGHIDVQIDGLQFKDISHPGQIDLMDMEEVDDQALDVIGEIDPGQIAGTIEFFVDEGDRSDPTLAGPEGFAHHRVGKG